MARGVPAGSGIAMAEEGASAGSPRLGCVAMGGERRESDRDTSGAEWLRRASRLTRKFACGLRRRVPHAGNRDVGRIASGSRAAGVLRRQGSRRSRQFACLDIAPCKVWWEAKHANSQVCL